jgi:competence ComEA-like helix-hairpin-helix protein
MIIARPHLAPDSWPLLIVLALAMIVAGCIKRHFPQSHLLSSNSSSAQQTNLRININTASAKELEQLPGIGPGLAARIVEHREKYGPFRRAEHLLIVRGISDKRFRALQELITAE